ncbi:MAG: hypothetical protein NUV80_04710 [Candidatus Berkelbacteria bacterium]|nr:hypothetical protein [Candidatus Berkelbacteria bacterium]MCR4307841.1 hypothetical protein [Candidatus Berkelbacteria bacterium]
MQRGARNPKLFGSSYVVPQSSGRGPRLDKSWRAILLFIILVTIFLLLGRLPVWRLTTVELLGDKNEHISAELNGLLGQSIFSSSVSRLISKTHNNLEVADFVCRRGLPATLRCSLSLRTAEIIWKSGESLYSVDKRGVLFTAQPTDLSDLLVVEDTQRQPIKLGSVVASPEIISQYRRLIELLSTKQLTAKTLLLNESLYQVTAIIERPGKNPIQGLFLLSGDSSSQVEALSGVLATKGDSITERVDVRVPGYVYTK